MPKGIINLGNTCFLNACLQVLLQTTEITSLPEIAQKQDIIENTVYQSWIAWKKIMLNDSDPSPNAPHAFIQCIHQAALKKDRPLFTGFAQNDMPEFLLFFTDCIHACFQRGVPVFIQGDAQNEIDNIAIKCFKMIESIYKDDYSEIRQLFYGIYVSNLVSLDEQTLLASNPEPFFLLNLPVHGSNLESCLQKYIAPEVLDHENAWLNENTQEKQSVYKQIVFWSFPKILVICLQRFLIEGNRISKKMDLIDFPLEDLDLSKYVLGYKASSYKYELYGICNHVGDVMGGHYTAFVKNGSGQWFHYNDHMVELVNNPALMVTPMAYCLFYRMKS